MRTKSLAAQSIQFDGGPSEPAETGCLLAVDASAVNETSAGEFSMDPAPAKHLQSELMFGVLFRAQSGGYSFVSWSAPPPYSRYTDAQERWCCRP